MAASIDPSKVLSSLTEWFLKLPLGQKVIFPLLLFGSFAGIMFVSNWANQPAYAVLFSDLEPQDSAAVIERLKELKVNYQVRNDGRTIAISPAESVHEMRISLIGEGVPKAGKVGYEIFQENNLGRTVMQEVMMQLNAVQGELERTITAIDSVASARVHIVKPEKSVFASKKAEPTASVLIKLRSGGELEKKQIKGIANLVAGAVEGLKPENVTIVDVRGNLLTPKEEGEDGLGIEATRLQYQREVERGYVQRIEQMLARVIGPEKVIARVTAELDFSQNEREEETYDPGGQVVRSERVIEEGSGSSQRGGVPGVVSNLSNDPNLLTPTTSESERNSRREEVKNYEVTRAVNRITSPRGKLTRLSAAVLVGGSFSEVPGADGAKVKEFVPLAPEMMSQIEAVVRSAVGYDPARGDAVTVESVPFFESETDFSAAMDGKEMKETIYGAITSVSPPIVFLLFLLIVVRPLVKFLTTPTDAEVDLQRLLPTGIQELETELEAERNKTQLPEFEPAVDLEQLEELMSENSRVVKENPQQAALLIRYWLNDGRL